MSLTGDLAPLQAVLDQILGRIQAIENKIGIASTVSTTATPESATDDAEVEDSPAVTAYDKHVQTSLEPFISTINALPGYDKSFVAEELRNAWSAIRAMVVAASKCKKPSEPVQIAPLLKPAQESIGNMRKARLAREYDNHMKALFEMLGCLGWVMIDATSEPPSPSLFVKNCVGSSDFWANKIRKEFKGKDDEIAKTNIKFCDALKALILDLSTYTKEYHMSGLAWKFDGMNLTDYKPADSSSSAAGVPAPPAKPAPITAPKPAISTAGGIASIKEELEKKRSTAGNSAATGLKKVTKDQQTWRKEYKNDGAVSIKAPSTTASSGSSTTPKPVTVKKTLPPVFEYRDHGSKWVIENQTKESTAATNGVIEVNITDPKQHVYIYKCNGVTFDIKGKSNNIIVDTCNKSNIVFDTVISSCEVVNCKRIQTQVRGICPSFSVDSTDGFLTYLSKESVEVTTFMTCKSCEMNGKFHYRMIIFYKHIVTFVVRLNYFLYFMTKNSELSR